MTTIELIGIAVIVIACSAPGLIELYQIGKNSTL